MYEKRGIEVSQSTDAIYKGIIGIYIFSKYGIHLNSITINVIVYVHIVIMTMSLATKRYLSTFKTCGIYQLIMRHIFMQKLFTLSEFENPQNCTL